MPTKIYLRKLPKRSTRQEKPPVSSSSLQNALRPAFFPSTSIRRELSERSCENTDDAPLERKVDDIRGSPRLTGYIFNMIAAAVMIISLIEFNRQRKKDSLQGFEGEKADDTFVYFLGDAVYRWKIWGALIASASGLLLSFITVMLHFDTLLAPTLWIRLFRDGSVFERNWIIVLILYWAGAVFVSTSTLSVGESQANVFFAAWFAFSSMALNYKVWRDSADFPDSVFRRETSSNWFWVAIFSFIFAVAATDMYFNRKEVLLQYRGQTLDLVDNDWLIILVAVWAEVSLCLIAMAMNEFIAAATTYQVPFCNVILMIGWRQLEVLAILVATGTKFWVILEYAAAVDGVISGLSNSYFGVWGSFLNSIFCLGTWMRENKDIEYFIHERNDRRLNNRRARERDADGELEEA